MIAIARAIALLVSFSALASGAAAAEPASPPPRRDEWQYLERLFTVDGFSSERPAPGRGFDGGQNAYRPDGLPGGDRLSVQSRRYGKVEFRRPPTDGDAPNFVPCEGQTIPVSTRRSFNVLFSLGAAHHGPQFGGIEFEFEDGTKGVGPIAFSDWYFEPVFGEETAFLLEPVGNASEPGGGVSIWLQRTPVPHVPGGATVPSRETGQSRESEKRIVAIRLPVQPNLKIFALTLGWRDGVEPIAFPPAEEGGKAEPGLVAIFGEPGFPHYGSSGDLTPERIRKAFVEAGIPAAVLGLEHLKDPRVFSVGAYPILVNPYGNSFPGDAEPSIRAYRKGGGAMVHVGTPLHHAVVRSPYGNWVDPGHDDRFLSHEGPLGLGIGGFRLVPALEIVAEPILEGWGLGGVDWDAYLIRGSDIPPRRGFQPTVLAKASLAPGDEVLPLLRGKTTGDDPFAAIVRHRGCPFDGAVDVRLAVVGFGLDHVEGPVSLTVELIVRSAAAVLKERGLIDAATWARATRPLHEQLRAPRRPEPVLPLADADGRLPRTAAISGRVAWSRIGGLDDEEKVLLASAQGLVNRGLGDGGLGDGDSTSVYLAADPGAEARLEAYRLGGLVAETVRLEPDGIIDLVGHRRAVIVDPEVYGSLNLAVMVAAAEGLLVSHPDLVERYRLEPVADLRGIFATGAEGYAWAMDDVWPALRSGCLALVRPDARSHAWIDYLIAHRVFTTWIPVGQAIHRRGASLEAETAEASRLLSRSPVGIPVITAPSGGGSGVEMPGIDPSFLSRFGKHRVPIDGLSNLSFTSGLRAVGIPGEPHDSPSGVGAPSGGGTSPAEVRGVAHPERVPANKVYVAQVSRALSDLRRLSARGVGGTASATASALEGMSPRPPPAAPRPALKAQVLRLRPIAPRIQLLRRIVPRAVPVPRPAEQRAAEGAERADSSDPATGRSGAAAAEGESADSGGSNGGSNVGYLLARAAFDLLPAETAAALAAMGEGDEIGCSGMGEVDLTTLGTAYGPASERVASLIWALTARSMERCGQSFFLLGDWRTVGGPEIALAARHLPSGSAILLEPRAGVEIGPREAAYVLDGRTVLHALAGDLGDLTRRLRSDASIARTRPIFTWATVGGTIGATVVGVGQPASLHPDIVLLAPGELVGSFGGAIERSARERVVLVPEGAVWRYHDQGVDLGREWRAPGCDDSAWAEGRAELGYGDGGEGRPEATVVSFGPDAERKHPTTYFRRSFEVGDPGRIEGLTLEVLRDDGCVVYINGEEAGRSNMPEGEIEYGTYASRAVGSDEEPVWQSLAPSLAPRATLLRRGRNVVAVEVHQSSASSSDLSFDLRLTAHPAPDPR